MEWIKQMSLKKALFTLTFTNLLIAAVLSILVFWACIKFSTTIAPQGVTLNVSLDSIERAEFSKPSADAARIGDICSLLQIALPVLFFVIALVATASMFYRWKLKEPLAILTDGANRIMDNDLDFVIEAKTGDELGLLCSAFETMRQSLLKNHLELWGQTEPLIENLSRIENYTSRIERYVETMSNVQRLEQVQLKKAPVDPVVLAKELENALSFAESDSGKRLSFCSACSIGEISDIMLDKNVLFEITENLVSNALRFAKQSVVVSLSIQPETLIFEVTDDGNGFPGKLLKSGIQPFQKCGEEAAHFGMGLYICELLCQKHGGTLKMENLPTGAKATAVLRLYTKNAF